MQYQYNRSSSAANYEKAMARLRLGIRSGRFARYTQQKKQAIWHRLCRYARQLGIGIKAPLAAACIAAGLCIAAPATAQTFTPQTGTDNPLVAAIGYRSRPAFVDIDGDGDMDAFVGNYGGSISYYKNVGTKTAPIFTLQTGVLNPFNGVTIDDGAYSYSAAPVFVDIDGDGDMDAFVGSTGGHVYYYKNTGTATVPVFTRQLGTANPLNAVAVGGYYAAPAFVDIDGDGDMDLFVGSFQGSSAVAYYKNTGTKAAPVFALQTAANNPLNILNIGHSSSYYYAPAFADIDFDGDMDFFVGNIRRITYYKNTGTKTTPVFAAGTLNIGTNAAGENTPAFVDIDGDGDMDLFVGHVNGYIEYLKNTGVALPLRLLAFTGTAQAGKNLLQWQTADETNTKTFVVERGTDGSTFASVATTTAVGSGANHYGLTDLTAPSGKVFYRLKMVDVDGSFTYSQIIWLGGGATIAATLYPNPAVNVLNLAVGNTALFNTTASLYDAGGKLVRNVQILAAQQQLDVQLLATGVYLLKFVDGTGVRFIKK